MSNCLITDQKKWRDIVCVCLPTLRTSSMHLEYICYKCCWSFDLSKLLPFFADHEVESVKLWLEYPTVFYSHELVSICSGGKHNNIEWHYIYWRIDYVIFPEEKVPFQIYFGGPNGGNLFEGLQHWKKPIHSCLMSILFSVMCRNVCLIMYSEDCVETISLFIHSTGC